MLLYNPLNRFDRACCSSAQLLVDDGMGQGFKGLETAWFEGTWSDMLDQPGHDGVEVQML